MENLPHFDGMENPFFLIGLLSVIANRLQTAGDSFFKEISWKQCFVLICVRLFPQPPSLKELARAFGTSHQNVKQLLLKLERGDFVRLAADPRDKRKQRVLLTDKADAFDEKYNLPSKEFVSRLFRNIDPGDLAITVAVLTRLEHNLKEGQDE